MLADAMRDGPLTPGEYAVYSAIFELEAASPTELARRLGMRLTTFMDQLRLVEGRGHARRVPHPTDRRSYRVVLTAAGLAAHRAANRRFEAAYQAVMAQLAGREAAAKQGLHAARTAVEGAIAGFEAPDAGRLDGGPRPSLAPAGAAVPPAELGERLAAGVREPLGLARDPGIDPARILDRDGHPARALVDDDARSGSGSRRASSPGAGGSRRRRPAPRTASRGGSRSAGRRSRTGRSAGRAGCGRRGRPRAGS